MNGMHIQLYMYSSSLYTRAFIYVQCTCMSIPVQDNNGVERTFGDCAVRKKYSHIDLIHMIDGVETQKATICAGNRCYYLKVCTVYITTSIKLRVHI